MDPWGDQRADQRMAKLIEAMIRPHTKDPIDPNDFLLFPDEAHDLPEDVDAQERAWMMKLQRTGG